ncbi:MAG: TetR family transcriptional regulator [Candidatus Marinimicrobia bacterium]|nr:TetR family transcriptional regulator [Candidatus Neomarinimicrobiota bacterium]
MRRTKEEAEATRQSILDTALLEFADKGYSATKLHDIALKAGVTRGAIYWHFENKADLYLKLQDEISGETNAVIQEAIDEGGTFQDIIKRVLVRSLEYMERSERFRSFMQLIYTKTEMSPELEEGWERKIEQGESTLQGLIGIFESARQEGQIKQDVNPRELAFTFLALQNGAATLRIMLDESYSLSDMADGIANILLHGITP